MSRSTYTALVTAVGGNTAQGIIKALRASELPFTIVGLDAAHLSAGFSLVDRYHRTARVGNPEYALELERIIEAERPDAIYVCSPPELACFSEWRARLEARWNVKVFVQPEPVVAIGADKYKTYEFLAAHGFTHPRTCLATETDRVEALLAATGFPVILKPRKGASSINVFKIRNRDELRSMSLAAKDDMVVQELVGDDDDEYTATTVAGADHRVRACIVLHRDLLQGTTYRTELLRSEPVTRHVTAVAEALKTVGACNFQLRLHKGEPHIFEINPRFSGTSGIRYLYGFNDPEMVFKLLRLGQEVSQPALVDSVVLRYWNEICLPGATFDALRSGVKPHRGYQVQVPEAHDPHGAREQPR